MIWVTAYLLLFVVQLAIILAYEYRRPSRFVAWTVILFVLPVVGIFVYYAIAQSFRTRRIARQWRRTRRRSPFGRGEPGRTEAVRATAAGPDDGAFERLHRLAGRVAHTRVTSANEVTVYADTQAMYEAIIAAMERAQDHIHAEYYTIRNDGIGRRFQQLWIRKAQEGVAVRVIYDGVGSYKLNESFLAPLRQAGVEVRCFLPPLVAALDRRINYRNHRKSVIVDGTVGFFGGANIGDEYVGRNPKLGYWRDTQVELRGDAVYDLQRIFVEDWEFVGGRRLDDPMLFPEHRAAGGERVQLLPSGPDSRYDPMLEVFFTALSLARRRIWIETPYFVPDPSLYMALKTAAVAGVDVRMIIPDVPDSKLVYYASLSYLEELLDAGVKVYRYRKGFIHAKVLIVDEAVATTGSANVDMRSFYSNFECNALFYDRGAIGRLAADFVADLKDSTEIRPDGFRGRPRVRRWMEGIARLLSPLL